MKQITTENWLTHDPIMNVFVAFSDAPNNTVQGGTRLVSHAIEPQLQHQMPEGIVRLYEMARGAICYGCFFYPLYTLGMEQLHRCLDAALKQKIEMLNDGKSPKRFKERIEWAITNKVIASVDAGRWDAIRELRNEGAHPTGHTIMPPGEAIHSLHIAADLLNDLFKNREAAKSI